MSVACHLGSGSFIWDETETSVGGKCTDQPRRILTKRVRMCGPQYPTINISCSPVGVDESSRVEINCHRVGGEITSLKICLDGQLRIDSDLSLSSLRSLIDIGTW